MEQPRGYGDKGYRARDEVRRSRSNKAGAGQDDTDRDLTIQPRYLIHGLGGPSSLDGQCAGRPTISMQDTRHGFASFRLAAMNPLHIIRLFQSSSSETGLSCLPVWRTLSRWAHFTPAKITSTPQSWPLAFTGKPE